MEALKYSIGETILLEVGGVFDITYNEGQNMVILMENGERYMLTITNSIL